jgi:hypothetical protein
MATQSRHWRLIILGVVAAMVSANSGCRHKGMESQVEGTVTWKNEPLRGVSVSFVPDGELGESVLRSVGTTDEAGHYVLRCLNGKAGTVAGPHRVLIVDPVVDPSRAMKGERTKEPLGAKAKGLRENPRFPTLYAKLESTPLRKEVAAGKQQIDFNLP